MVTQRTVRQVRRVMLWSLTALLTILAISIAFSTWRVFGTLSQVKNERREAEIARDALKVRTAELQASVGALKTDRGVEEEIRSRYPLVKPGEIEFVFVEKGTESQSAQTKATSTVWGRVKSFFSF